MRELTTKRERDARWADGRTFGMVYDGGPLVHEVAERSSCMRTL
jgi:sphinganine-1-phosphate aldolase